MADGGRYYNGEHVPPPLSSILSLLRLWEHHGDQGGRRAPVFGSRR